MSVRPPVTAPTTYGDPTSSSYWIEDPSGLVDLSHSKHPSPKKNVLEFEVSGERRVRIEAGATALVVIDMQKLREEGVLVVWLNWGLKEAEISGSPASLSRCFSKPKLGKPVDPPGFGHDLGNGYGRILLRGEWNAKLYGPLEGEWERNKDKDAWVNKNRMSGFAGVRGSELELELAKRGMRTLLFAGVNADQCVLGTVTESFSRGYDTIVVEDLVATTSPDGAKSNLIFNALHCYGFVANSEQLKQMKRV
ncbi:isochorismatase domain-containing protein 2 [Ceratobasidium sp. AG-Ba]|nr:isochorismatase domain-containing protein 2 [Ceratobasidium sp. AG-Ba]